MTCGESPVLATVGNSRATGARAPRLEMDDESHLAAPTWKAPQAFADAAVNVDRL